MLIEPILSWGERGLALAGVHSGKQGVVDTQRRMQRMWGKEDEFQLCLEGIRLLSSDILT